MLSTVQSPEELEARKMDVSLQFASLKKLNRLAHFRCRKAREGTNEVSDIIIMMTEIKSGKRKML